MRAGRIILAALLLLYGGCRRKPQDLNASLHRAVGKADRAQVLSLLAAGADVNAKDRSGTTALHGVARIGHKKMVDLLLTHGADADANDAYCGTPLHIAVEGGHVAVTQSLIAAGANVNSRGSYHQATPLELAFLWRHVKVAGLLLSAGADPGARNRWGRTVLHDVALEGSAEFARLIFAHWGQVNARDIEGLTPLHEAAWANQLDVASLLLAHGADINAKDIYGETPLHVAARNDYKQLLELLMTAGADATLKDDQGLTALDYMNLPAAQPMVILRADGKSPYAVIMTNPSAVRKFLRGEEIGFDRVWIPGQNDIEGIDFRAAIEANSHIETKTWFDLEYILGHLQEYNREYAGFISKGRKYLLCNMDFNEFHTEPRRGQFSWAYDGGCSLARVVIDLANKTVVRIDCNGN